MKKFNELRYLKTEEEGESVLKNRLSFWIVKTFFARTGTNFERMKDGKF